MNDCIILFDWTKQQYTNTYNTFDDLISSSSLELEMSLYIFAKKYLKNCFIRDVNQDQCVTKF